ncbi:hypothetical protein [Roseomonas populi]|uniref:Secreted protein n=1 Tax=Roseomonas populi TaxID=3121582 RepID=A0ABT1WXR2_9PROT|nr:hypothetical protein [Roseomonas pecuniae]MCR0980625.1 hypothetical protein [Roseomonas pecuniae]
MSARRRGLLAVLGGGAVVAPALPIPASATPPSMGPVEALARQIPAFSRACDEAEAAWLACPGPEAEKDRLYRASMDAAGLQFDCEDLAMATPPETVMDALLVIALVAAHTHRAAGCDMEHPGAEEKLEGAARYARRAADFIAASMGRDIAAVLGAEYAIPEARA